MNRKKCVIIGSGLGGLSNGVILSRNGYEVTVLEQAPQIGGCLQCFRRKGVKFETGMHFIGSAAPGETLNQLMRYLALDDIPLSQLDPDGYDIVSLAGDKFKIPNGWEAFASQLGNYFPAERDNLKRYIAIVKEIAASSSFHSMRFAESDFAKTAHYQTMSMNSVLDDIFRNETLKNLLAGNLPLYSAELDKTPFSLHAFIMNFYNPGAYRIIGGSDIIAESLTRTIRNSGGEVRTSSRVTKIVCDDTKAIGVEVNGSEFFPADIVIAAIHPARVMEILDTKMIRPAFRNRMMNLTNTAAAFSLYLSFKPGQVRYQNFNYYSYKRPTPWNCEHYTTDEWPKGYLYMHFCDAENQQYAKSGVILSYMNYSEVANWAGMPIGRRGDEYEQFKQHRAELLLNRLEEEHPGIKCKIEAVYSSTPLTYEDYTGTEHGSMYGVAKDVTLGAACRVPHRTKVPNLLMSGQNINSHGMLGVLVGSIVTCSELLTPETVYNQIIEANK